MVASRCASCLLQLHSGSPRTRRTIEQGENWLCLKDVSRTPSMYVDEKSDEAIVLAKRLNKGRQLPAEVMEGKGLTQGDGAAVSDRGSDTEPKCRVDPNDGCASGDERD